MAEAVSKRESNTMSMGFTILGLDAYARAVPATQTDGIRLFEIAKDGVPTPLSSSAGLVTKAKLSPTSRAIKLEGDTNLPLFYQLVQAGFDVNPPTTAVARRIEAFHELKNEQGEAVTEIGIDDKLYVHLFLRATEGTVNDVAVIDLLPGGFEVDLSPEGLGGRKSLPSKLVTWEPDYVDVREDRVVFYGDASSTARPFIYRLKPTNKGRFNVPPSYAVGMYDRSAVARSLGSKIEVKE